MDEERNRYMLHSSGPSQTDKRAEDSEPWHPLPEEIRAILQELMDEEPRFRIRSGVPKSCLTPAYPPPYPQEQP